jgi:hypothetical protein
LKCLSNWNNMVWNVQTKNSKKDYSITYSKAQTQNVRNWGIYITTNPRAFAFMCRVCAHALSGWYRQTMTVLSQHHIVSHLFFALSYRLLYFLNATGYMYEGTTRQCEIVVIFIYRVLIVILRFSYTAFAPMHCISHIVFSPFRTNMPKAASQIKNTLYIHACRNVQT